MTAELIAISDIELERFWAKVRKSPRCWIWIGAKNDHGYGQLWVGRKARYAHRLSYEIHYGEPVGALFVCHRCDNPPCVRPDHLFLGTDADNKRDMKMKGRARNAPTHGEACPSSKLTEAQVRRIRELADAGHSQYALAEQFGTSQSNISRIVRREMWRHLVDAPLNPAYAEDGA